MQAPALLVYNKNTQKKSSFHFEERKKETPGMGEGGDRDWWR